MNCVGSDNLLSKKHHKAFTFMEVVAALAILSVITFGVLVVINRGVASMLEGQARAQAFDLARENMEKLLTADSVTDMSEFGTHELNDEIEWETVVEPFDEPVDSEMWIRAVCTASYLDRYDERQTIELVQWLTNVSATIQRQILDQRKREQKFLENMEGNPFGDDPDGLMKYGKALESMGEFVRAAAAFLRVAMESEDAAQAASALNEALDNAWKELQENGPEEIGPIIEKMKENFPDDDDVQDLPDVDDLEPGEPIPAYIIPARFRAPETKPADIPKDDKPSDTGGSTPDQPRQYKGWDLPDDFYTWPAKDQQTYKDLIGMLPPKK
jgi:prepilin-type N-terminal cleavage/methylation domain-containing protein